MVTRKSGSRSLFFRDDRRKGGTESMDTPKDSAIFSIITCEGRFSIRFDVRFAREDRFLTGAWLLLRRLLSAVADAVLRRLDFHISSTDVMECMNSLRLQRVMWRTGIWWWGCVWVRWWWKCIVALVVCIGFVVLGKSRKKLWDQELWEHWTRIWCHVLCAMPHEMCLCTFSAITKWGIEHPVRKSHENRALLHAGNQILREILHRVIAKPNTNFTQRAETSIMSLVLFLLTQQCRCDNEVPKPWLATSWARLKKSELLHAHSLLLSVSPRLSSRLGLALRVPLHSCLVTADEFLSRFRIPRTTSLWDLNPTQQLFHHSFLS